MKRIKCFFFRRKLVEYFYGEVTPREKELLKFHIEICPYCKKILEEMEYVSRETEKAFEPQIPETSLKLYPQQIIIRISEQKLSKQKYRRARVKKGLVFASCIIFLGIMLHTTKFYLIEKEIESLPEFYQNLELIWNLDLINGIAEDESFVATIFNQDIPEESNLIQNSKSKRELHFIVHHFKNLPDLEKNLILANYQQWINTPPLQKKLHQKVYHYLKKIDHPELKKIIFK